MPPTCRNSACCLAFFAILASACGDSATDATSDATIEDSSASDASVDDVAAFDTRPRDTTGDDDADASADADVEPDDAPDDTRDGEVMPDDDADARDADDIVDAIDAADGGPDDADSDAAPCDDEDRDLVCDDLDLCPLNDDNLDDDTDGVPNGCDVCDGDDTVDEDEDGAPDACDRCPGLDDRPDADSDGLPDCLDLCPDDGSKMAPGQCGCGLADTDTDADLVADCVDLCPLNPTKVEGLICGCDAPDTDTDADGAPDCLDRCPTDALKMGPGECGCGVADTDTDSDRVADCVDSCPDSRIKVEPGTCGCDLPDIDTDGDGTLDCLDHCPLDSLKLDPGVCGCGALDVDADSDRVFACDDACDLDPLKVVGGVCGCGVADVNSDTDALLDCQDNCPLIANADQADASFNGVGDVCDTSDDTDGDGVVDAVDCRIFDPTVSPSVVESCNNRDDDCDGVIDEEAVCGCDRFEAGGDIYLSCPIATSWSSALSSCRTRGYDLVAIGSSDESAFVAGLLAGVQAWIGMTDEASEGFWRWSNGSDVTFVAWGAGEPNNSGNEDCAHTRPDGLWNDTICSGSMPRFVCESGCSGPDSDGDGRADPCDRCPSDRDNDLDGDGVCGDVDACPTVFGQSPLDTSGDGVPDACDNGDFDGDSVIDRLDACPADAAKTLALSCGCGVAETNTDGDGWADCVDRCPSVAAPDNGDADRDGRGDACDSFTDTDGDGFADADDCHTTNPALFPGAAELCNGVDDDCAASTPDSAACGCVEQSFGGGTYRYCSTARTYGAAVSLCRSMRGFDVVAVDDEIENSSLVATLGAGFWLGLSDGVSEGNFVWANGATSTWRNWSPGEPNDSSGEDCSEVFATGLWNDVSCGAARTVVCELGCTGEDPDSDGLRGSCDACPADPFNDSDGDGMCAPTDLCPGAWDPTNADWNNDGVGDVCDLDTDADADLRPDGTELCRFDPAKASEGTCGCGWADVPGCTDTCGETRRGDDRWLLCWPNRTWQAALADCESQGASLATLSTSSGNSLVASLFAARGIAQFWIGANDIASEGAWGWSSGAPWSFSAWVSGEPNNQGAGTGEDCAQAHSATGLWNDLTCTSVLPYACSN